MAQKTLFDSVCYSGIREEDLAISCSYLEHTEQMLSNAARNPLVLPQITQLDLEVPQHLDPFLGLDTVIIPAEVMGDRDREEPSTCDILNNLARG